MKKSKFIGQQFDNGWTCTNIFLAANYSHSTKHNAYRYQLSRITSDGKCEKKITISGSTMTRLTKNLTTAEHIANWKKDSTELVNEILYSFR